MFAKVFRAVLVALVLFAGANAAQASPIFTITNLTGDSLGNPPFTLGFEFTVDAGQQFMATDLGLFDSSQDGLFEAHAIGLWDAGGTLLASTTIPAGLAAGLTNQFRYVAIAPVLLNAGNYRVGAVFTSGSDPNIFPGGATGFAMAAGMTFVGSRFIAGAALTDPTATAGADPSYFGPNINATAVPEPFTVLLVGAGLASGLARRRRA
jgi:hypothetical protein